MRPFPTQNIGNTGLFILAAAVTASVILLSAVSFRHQEHRADGEKNDRNTVYLLEFSPGSRRGREIGRMLELYDPASAIRSDGKINFAASWKAPGRKRAVSPGMPERRIAVPPEVEMPVFHAPPASPADDLPLPAGVFPDENDPGAKSSDAREKEDRVRVFVGGKEIEVAAAPPPRPDTVGASGGEVKFRIFRRNGVTRCDVVSGSPGRDGKLMNWADKTIEGMIANGGQAEMVIVFPRVSAAGGKREGKP